MDKTIFKLIILINLTVFVVGNAFFYLLLLNQPDANFMNIVMACATFTSIHIATGIVVSLVYRVTYHISPQGRAWFWSTILVALLGLAFYIFLTS